MDPRDAEVPQVTLPHVSCRYVVSAAAQVFVERRVVGSLLQSNEGPSLPTRAGTHG